MEYHAQNLDRLTADQQDLVALYMALPTGWTSTYMVEVRLDDPERNILKGGDGLVTHGGNGSRRYAKHYGDPDWAVIHYEDQEVLAWDMPAMEARAMKRIEEEKC